MAMIASKVVERHLLTILLKCLIIIIIIIIKINKKVGFYIAPSRILEVVSQEWEVRVYV